MRGILYRKYFHLPASHSKRGVDRACISSVGCDLLFKIVIKLELVAVRCYEAGGEAPEGEIAWIEAGRQLRGKEWVSAKCSSVTRTRVRMALDYVSARAYTRIVLINVAATADWTFKKLLAFVTEICRPCFTMPRPVRAL